MPNHCMNYLNVTGQYKDILKFILETHGIDEGDGEPHYKFSFQKILPTPLKENGDIIDEWYEWRLKHWGCKWDCYDEFGRVNVNKNFVEVNTSKFNPSYLTDEFVNNKDVEAEYSIGFCTAWAPPLDLYNHIVEVYKDLDLKFRIQYDECGCAFAGHSIFHKGEVLEDVYVDISEPINYYEYIIENEIEDIDYLLENIFNSIIDNHPDQSNEFINRLYEKIESIMRDDKVTTKQKAKLYAEICLNVKEEKTDRKNITGGK